MLIVTFVLTRTRLYTSIYIYTRTRTETHGDLLLVWKCHVECTFIVVFICCCRVNLATEICFHLCNLAFCEQLYNFVVLLVCSD